MSNGGLDRGVSGGVDAKLGIGLNEAHRFVLFGKGKGCGGADNSGTDDKDVVVARFER